MTPLAGKVAVVTGASRGIGAAIARRLSAEGVRLGLASPLGRRPRAARHRLDILVAYAGVGAYGPFAELPPEQLEEMIDTNVKGVLHAAFAVRTSARAASPPTSRWAKGAVARRRCRSWRG
jgi:NADP-dependent 3-hydroxy acid dehydrogenase YdfG